MSSTACRPPVRAVASAVAALLAVPVGLVAAGGTAVADGAGTVDVYPSGGAAAIQAAVNAATPGTTIRIHQGTYDGAIRVARSGTATAPITLTSAGDGRVTLTANLPKPACSALAPAQQRTIVFTNGADDWTVQGLTIVGGIIGVGAGAQQVLNWNRALMASGDWATRRAIPGRGVNDPSAAASAVSAMATRLGRALNPVDRIRILDNDITGMGVQMSMARWGSVVGNAIHDIACGTGPGVWLGNLSDGWTVTGNHVWNIAADTAKHYMYEGIRLANASDYNVVSDNLVEHIPSDGRAFTTDEDSSWNLFSNDVARDVNIGFNDEMSGWGNVWTHDTSTDHRSVGF